MRRKDKATVDELFMTTARQVRGSASGGRYTAADSASWTPVHPVDARTPENARSGSAGPHTGRARATAHYPGHHRKEIPGDQVVSAMLVITILTLVKMTPALLSYVAKIWEMTTFRLNGTSRGVYPSKEV